MLKIIAFSAAVSLIVFPTVAFGGATTKYRFDENKYRNRCKTNQQCDGKRTCTYVGYCTGRAR